MKFKKTTCLLLSIIISISILSGCSSKLDQFNISREIFDSNEKEYPKETLKEEQKLTENTDKISLASELLNCKWKKCEYNGSNAALVTYEFFDDGTFIETTVDTNYKTTYTYTLENDELSLMSTYEVSVYIYDETVNGWIDKQASEIHQIIVRMSEDEDVLLNTPNIQTDEHIKKTLLNNDWYYTFTNTYLKFNADNTFTHTLHNGSTYTGIYEIYDNEIYLYEDDVLMETLIYSDYKFFDSNGVPLYTVSENGLPNLN